jgi:hypothetical protein
MPRILRTPLITLLVFLLVGCTLPGPSGPTPFTFPTPNLTLTAIFAPAVTLPPIAPSATHSTAPSESPGETTPPPAASPTTAITTATTGANDARPNGTPVTAALLTTPPTIDGDLSEWTASAYPAGHIVHGATSWTGGSDLSAVFYAGWDASYLYLAVRITDDQFVQLSTGVTMYRGDIVEVQFDANLSGDFDQDTLSSDDYQIGLSPGNFGGIAPEAYRWYPVALSGPLATVDLKGAQTSQGWDLEARLPWSVFGVSASGGSRFGLALSVSDNDLPGTATQQSMVSSVSTRLHLDPTSWGTLILGQ